VAQETLRSDEAVRVVGGEFNDCVGIIKSIDIPTESATLIFSTSGGDTSNTDKGTLEAAVPIRTLERHFKIGDNVHWVSAEGEERFGMVVELLDWGLVDYDEFIWQHQAIVDMMNREQSSWELSRLDWGKAPMHV
jgi:hypothetical protein